VWADAFEPSGARSVLWSLIVFWSCISMQEAGQLYFP
jgi:hypothetical protein